MTEPNLPSYAILPNSPDHQPNVTPPGVMTTDEPYKMGKQIMKLAKQMAHQRKPAVRTPSRPRARTQHKKLSTTKWY